MWGALLIGQPASKVGLDRSQQSANILDNHFHCSVQCRRCISLSLCVCVAIDSLEPDVHFVRMVNRAAEQFAGDYCLVLMLIPDS
jgi:hypothetical protein